MNNKPFPSERVNNFSDAIFAIGITLLVLEIKIPTQAEISELGVNGVLIKRIPNFVGFFVSFLVTALYWRSHLQLFQHVKTINNKLLWLNLWLLIFVVLLPFSTALYSYYFNINNAFVFYCLNLAGMGLMTFWMTAYVLKNEKLSEILPEAEMKWMKRKAAIAPAVFFICIPMAYILPWVARLGFVLIFVIQLIGDRSMKKRKAVVLESSAQ
jgi:uncharacterized membrane protein